MANGNDRFTGLLGNPMFTVGMGLLSGNQQGDPWGGVMTGLQSAQRFQMAEQDREREEQLRRELQQYLAGNQRQTPGMGPPGHMQPPRTVAEAATMRAQAMGEAPPELSQADYFTPVGQAQTSPAGLLDTQASPASVQQVNTPLPQGVVTDEMIEADPSVSVGPSAPPGTPPELAVEPAGNEVGTPQQQIAQAQRDAMQGVQGLLGEQGGQQFAEGNADAMAMFGLLAQYGDPQKAAEGYLNYQLGQQRLQVAQNSARTRGFTPIVDEQGFVYFPDINAPGGVTQATDAQGNPIKAPPGITYQTDAAGNIIALPKRGGIGGGVTPTTIVDAEDVERDVQNRADIERQREARRSLPGLEEMLASPTGAWTTINAILSPELEGARELAAGKSAPAGWLASLIPGTDSANLAALRTKLTAQSFTQSIADLRARGATVGQVTEVEGTKLQNALLTLQSTTSDEAFERELNNFRDALKRFIIAARREANPGLSEVDYYAPTIEGGVDLRTPGEAARDAAAEVEIENDRLQQLQERYPQTRGQ